jgi:hypothetical protein
MNRSLSLALTPALFALLLSASACSGDADGDHVDQGDAAPLGTDSATTEETAPADTATADTSTADTATADTTTPDAGGETAAVKPATPTIVGIMSMGGAPHVTWKLNDKGLTSVILWRKSGAGEYAKAYTLPGTATDQHDGAASGAGPHCYKVETVRGDLHSDLSNEKCLTP